MPLPLGFVPPCLPTKASQPPTGDAWLHEIKHDGFRVVARKDGDRIRLYSRPGKDLTYRFSLIVEALARLRVALLHHRRRGGVLRRRRRAASIASATAATTPRVPVRVRPDRARRRRSCAASRWRCARPRSPRCSRRPRPACGSTTTSRPTVPPCSPRVQDGPGGHRVEAEDLDVPLGPFARLAQEQEPERSGSEGRGGRGLAKEHWR